MIDLRLGDCLELMRDIPDGSVDAVITDPPAGISFMGKDWDHDKGGRDAWVAWMTSIMRECLRVLKPGGHALVWALPRTSHWTGWAIEEAGFEIRDRLAYLFGSGFPKSCNVSKQIDKAVGAEREVIGDMDRRSRFDGANRASYEDVGESQCSGRNTRIIIDIPATDAARQWNGWGTALKPACEDWWLGRKPLSEPTIAANVLKWGVGALNIDACRIEAGQDYQEAGFGPRYGATSMPNMGKHQTRPWVQKAIESGNPVKDSRPNSLGRWPANVTHDSSPEVLAVFPQSDVSGSAKNGKPATGEYPGGYGGYAGKHQGPLYNDPGSAARFFACLPTDDEDMDVMRFLYCPKASKQDRDEGLDESQRNHHPTVKAIFSPESPRTISTLLCK